MKAMKIESLLFNKQTFSQTVLNIFKSHSFVLIYLVSKANIILIIYRIFFLFLLSFCTYFFHKCVWCFFDFINFKQLQKKSILIMSCLM